MEKLIHNNKNAVPKSYKTHLAAFSCASDPSCTAHSYTPPTSFCTRLVGGKLSKNKNIYQLKLKIFFVECELNNKQDREEIPLADIQAKL